MFSERSELAPSASSESVGVHAPTVTATVLRDLWSLSI
jgi:hypothetical protein